MDVKPLWHIKENRSRLKILKFGQVMTMLESYLRPASDFTNELVNFHLYPIPKDKAYTDTQNTEMYPAPGI